MYELFQDLCKVNTVSYPVAKFARDANSAYAYYMWLAIRASQKWQVDDTNQSDYPIITINLVSGQQDYPFTNDASSTPNQILDITRVEMLTPSGVAITLSSYDQTEESNSLTQAATISGTPSRYDKLANGIWLDPKPNYASTNGLKVYFQRTPIYFLSTDTTKKPGIPDMFHEYLVYRAAYLYCITNLPTLAAGYLVFVTKMETDIANFYYFRNKDEIKVMRPRIEDCK